MGMGNLFQADVEEEPYQVTELQSDPSQIGKVVEAQRADPNFSFRDGDDGTAKGNLTSSVDDSASRTSMETTLAKLKLSDLINMQTKDLKVDVSDIIDFAMIGNPKTGTTFMSEQWIGQHPDLITPKFEMRAMVFEKGPGRSIELLFPYIKQKLPPKKLGYKCPADVREIRALANLREYFPKTKLIIGIRHPVWWFQSFTNYRIRHDVDIPSPMQSRGPCRKVNANACTYNAYFHVQIDGQKVPKVAEALREDLSAFLELDTLLPSLETAQPRVHEDNSTAADPNHFRRRREREVVNICEPQYKELRDELVLVGRDAAEWIETYFMPLPNVIVSSPDYFRQVLSTYQADPCEVEESSNRKP
eukprot:scaffold13016_cov154-Amphora_coffeaeformis.AAC.9